MSNEKRAVIEKKLFDWSSLGRRVVVMCKLNLPLDNLPFYNNFEKWFKSCHSLCFVGMIAFLDPPKMDIHESIIGIRKLGIRVIMATGDYSITAGSIAKEV